MEKADYHQLAKVLEVLSLLTKYGYYVADSDVKRVLNHLVDILQKVKTSSGNNG